MNGVIDTIGGKGVEHGLSFHSFGPGRVEAARRGGERRLLTTGEKAVKDIPWHASTREPP